jgi:hypothetical protein
MRRGHQGQAYKQCKQAKLSEAMARSIPTAGKKSPAPVASLRAGPGRPPRRARVVAAKTAFVPQRLLRRNSYPYC